MRSSKTLFYVSFLFLFQYSYAQVKLRWVDVNFIDKQTISAKIFVQNFGNIARIHNKYGAHLSLTKYDKNFFIEYDVIYKDDHANYHHKNIPSSITIETIVGTSLPMEQPIYNFYPTGSTKGEYWDVIFIVPKNIANIKINILNKTYSMEDTAEAIENENNRKSRFMNQLDRQVFKYRTFFPKHYELIYSDIRTALIRYSFDYKEFNCKGRISFIVDQDGQHQLLIDTEDAELQKYIQTYAGHNQLKKTQRYGVTVKAQALFDFIMQKGKYKAKYSKGGELESISSPFVYEAILENVHRDIDHNGTYKIKYTYMTVNGELVSGTGYTIRRIPI